MKLTEPYQIFSSLLLQAFFFSFFSVTGHCMVMELYTFGLGMAFACKVRRLRAAFVWWDSGVEGPVAADEKMEPGWYKELILHIKSHWEEKTKGHRGKTKTRPVEMQEYLGNGQSIVARVAGKLVPVSRDDDIDHAVVLELRIANFVLGLEIFPLKTQLDLLARLHIAVLLVLLDEECNSRRLLHVSNSDDSTPPPSIGR